MTVINKSLLIFCITYSAFGAPYKELLPKFNRLKSVATIREVTLPTYANLDYAAYSKNPVLYDPVKATPKAPSDPISLNSATFNGAISDVKERFDSLPLTEEEKNNPISWRALSKKLWDVVKEQKFQNISGSINGYKWNDPSIFQSFQELTEVYLHNENGSYQFWAKIEFNPWVKFARVFGDEDSDGFPEIYGKLNLDDIDNDSLAKAVTWIKEYYLTHVCTAEEINDWIIDLASYWYPTRNTDIVDMSGFDVWPNSLVHKNVLKKLKGIEIRNPIAVVEAKPHSPEKPIYNVYIVNTLQNAGIGQSTEASTASIDKVIDISVSVNFTQNNKRFSEEIKKYGEYESWNLKSKAVLDRTQNYITSLPPEQMAIEGKNTWLFFRKSFEYLLGGDLSKQSKDKNPIIHLQEFNQYCKDSNINMLFIAVPNKEEVYPELLPVNTAEIKGYINPYSRKVLKDLQEAGVEVIDLLPAFLDAKKGDKNTTEALYQKHDTHWTNRGLQIAADLIAERVKEYAWYNDVTKEQFTAIDTSFERLGDIVDKMPEAQRGQFLPVKLSARQIYNQDSTLYKGNASSPIMLIGDSFTGVFESVDCKSAGVGANIAEKTGCSVDIITSWGGGPLVRQRALRTREKNLPQKRLIIYMMVARDLYNYAQSWEPLTGK